MKNEFATDNREALHRMIHVLLDTHHQVLVTYEDKEEAQQKQEEEG